MTSTPAPGRVPPGTLVYAVGDVHGCAGRLAALHEMIAADRARRSANEVVVVHLGDYVDRGPDSAAVVGRLAAGPVLAGASTVNLMGNHERTMLDALAGQAAARTDWLFNGGRAALESWGIDPASPPERWRDAIPAPHRALLEGLAMSHRVGDYLFVHAGLRPGIPVAAQSQADMLSIRQVFLSSAADFGAIVVHGHTPKPEPVLRPNRIGIDTGAVFGGKLTCLVLQGDRLDFLQA